MQKLLSAERLRVLPKASKLVSGKMGIQTHLPQVQRSFYYSPAASYATATYIPKENAMVKNVGCGVRQLGSRCQSYHLIAVGWWANYYLIGQ